NSEHSDAKWSGRTTFIALRMASAGRKVASDGPRHPPIRLRVVTHLEDVLAYPFEVPFAIESLGAEILLPDAEVHGFESVLSCRVQTHFHEFRRDAGSMPPLVEIKPDKFNRGFATNTFWNFTRKKLRVSSQF